jgi:hypothetical protein
MTDYAIDDIYVQGDTGPDPLYQLFDIETGDPQPLTDCDVYFQMRKPDDRKYTVNALATIMDAAEGKVRYPWGATDLDIAGIYQIQWEIHFPDNEVITTKELRYIEVRKQ